MPPARVSRRDALRSIAAAALVPALGRSAFATSPMSTAAPAVPPEFFIGTTVMPESLFTRGVATLLDEMRELAGVRTVMTFSNNVVTRQYRPEFAAPTDPATGAEATDVYVRVHEEFYRDTTLRQVRKPGTVWSDRDLLDELVAEARPRGMQVYARILEPYVITGAIPGSGRCAEIDAHGAPGPHHCFNHPEYVAFWDAVVTDLITTHPGIDGFKFGQERGGPIMRALGGEGATCFCEHCERLARARGIRVDEARAGFRELQAFAQAHRQPAGAPDPDRRPPDGHAVTLLRILGAHPDVFSWKRLWLESRENQRRRLHARIKAIRPSVQVGWHVDHGMSWDVVTRAFWDYPSMLGHTDWLSIALYFDAMGPRSFNHFRRNHEALILADADPALGHALFLSLLGYDPRREPDYARQAAGPAAFTAGYVAAETRRALAGVAGHARVYARIGFDMPRIQVPVDAGQVEAATFAALDAGADGLFIGREWDELAPSNAAACGRALHDWFARRS